MSFFQQSVLTTLGSKFDETRWVTQIRKTLDEELEEEIEIPVTIFGVPKALMLADPDSYRPQEVAIGPYHHLRLELYDMERYKVAAAKRIQSEHLNNVKLETLVDHLIKHELRIRACYHRPLSFGCEALAWMMAVDVCFVFEFIRVCGIKKGKILGRIPSGLSHLIDASGNKTAHNSILRDLLMLENQIPLFVMRMLLELQFPTKEIADQILLGMLTGMSRDLSPFKAVEAAEMAEVKEHAHLLDFLYHFIVPKSKTSFPRHEIEVEIGAAEPPPPPPPAEVSPSPSHLRKLVNIIWESLLSLKNGPIQWMKRLIFSKPLKVMVKLPWTVLGKIPILKMFKEPVENMMKAFHKDKEKKDDGDEDGDEESGSKNPPLQEEIKIPSVSQLAAAGVIFVATKEGISSIRFDEKALTFYFPVINLDVNSEVVLRNLVAYEACSASGPLIFARYTELMNGIIDTEVDARFLCERGIIVNHLKSEKEVADMWNGMSKSVRLTKVPSLDKVIADVNRFYSARWRVKMGKFMREYVFGSWKILTFLGAIAMLLLMCLQAFCEVYSCSRILPIKALAPTTNE